MTWVQWAIGIVSVIVLSTAAGAYHNSQGARKDTRTLEDQHEETEKVLIGYMAEDRQARKDLKDDVGELKTDVKKIQSILQEKHNHE